MYAIVESNGKQYRVEEGELVDMEKMEVAEHPEMQFKKILFLHDGEKAHVGTPYLSGYSIQGELVGVVKGPKVFAYKYKKRKNYHRKKGHRQQYSRVKILKIQKD